MWRYFRVTVVPAACCIFKWRNSVSVHNVLRHNTHLCSAQCHFVCGAVISVTNIFQDFRRRKWYDWTPLVEYCTLWLLFLFLIWLSETSRKWWQFSSTSTRSWFHFLWHKNTNVRMFSSLDVPNWWLLYYFFSLRKDKILYSAKFGESLCLFKITTQYYIKYLLSKYW